MKWVRKFFDALFLGPPRGLFPDRAADEEAVCRKANLVKNELDTKVGRASKLPGEVFEQSVSLNTVAFSDGELQRICRDAIPLRYGVRVSGRVLTVDYVVNYPGL